MTHLRLSPEAVAHLTKLLADLAATPGIDPAHRYEVAYSCDQVRERLPAIEGLVIAGLLHEAPERLALDRGAQAACRWWAGEFRHALAGNPSALSRPPGNSWQAAADQTRQHRAGLLPRRNG